jgi:hypothetical protein
VANAWVTQYRSAAIINGVSLDVPHGPPLRSEKITFTDTAGLSAAIASDCSLVAIYVDTNANWLAGTAPVADEEDTAIGAGSTFFIVPTGLHKFSFITLELEVPSLDFSDAVNSQYIALLEDV